MVTKRDLAAPLLPLGFLEFIGDFFNLLGKCQGIVVIGKVIFGTYIICYTLLVIRYNEARFSLVF